MAPKLRAFEQELRVALRGATDQVRRDTMVAVARQALSDVLRGQQARSGLKPLYEQRVDGRLGAPLESVKPNGNIRFDFDYSIEVANYANDVLFDLSPVRSGAYRASHLIFINGVEVPNLQGLEPGDEVSFQNLQPYARRIEHGSSQRQAPNGVYEAAAKQVRARYGSVCQVLFTYRAILGGRQIARPSEHGVAARKIVNASENRYPVITLRTRR